MCLERRKNNLRLVFLRGHLPEFEVALVLESIEFDQRAVSYPNPLDRSESHRRPN